MEFEWVDAKSKHNLRHRNFGFDYAALVFAGRRSLSQPRDHFGQSHGLRKRQPSPQNLSPGLNANGRPIGRPFSCSGQRPQNQTAGGANPASRNASSA